MQKYLVIVADPPWQYNNTGVEGSAQAQYATLSIDKICALPVSNYADDDCVLFLWATWPQLQNAFAVVSAWGFEYITGLPWIKIVGLPVVDLWGDLAIKPQYGTGFWVRGCSEPLLIAKRGNVQPLSRDFVGLLSENFGHSRKPENIYHVAEKYPGPYLEMFARRKRDGWDVWGNEVQSTIVFAASV